MSDVLTLQNFPAISGLGYGEGIDSLAVERIKFSITKPPIGNSEKHA